MKKIYEVTKLSNDKILESFGMFNSYIGASNMCLLLEGLDIKVFILEGSNCNYRYKINQINTIY